MAAAWQWRQRHGCGNGSGSVSAAAKIIGVKAAKASRKLAWQRIANGAMAAAWRNNRKRNIEMAKSYESSVMK
jgi:hypothetical protein